MKTRCYDPDCINYHRYGGRGIIICEEWLNDFATFYKWATSNGWEYGLEIDRKENDGNYEPDNCRFVTGAVNVQNSTVAKLTAEQVIEIRKRHALDGIDFENHGAIYGVTGATISHIVRRITWKNIP